MQFVRFLAHGEVAYGVVEDGIVNQITTSPFEEHEVTDHAHPIEHVQVLAPCDPIKGFAIALNYWSHLGDRPAPERVEPFHKTPNAFIGPEDTILLPKDAGRVEAEAELVVVIGRRCKNVTPDQALDYVLGYTCGVDVSERAWQRGDKSWWRAKSADTFAPLGPVIQTDLDLAAFQIFARVNGEQVQHCISEDMIFSIPDQISVLSQYVTLEPGDVIYTGTGGVPGQITPGDTLEVEIPGIGVLRNSVGLGE